MNINFDTYIIKKLLVFIVFIIASYSLGFAQSMSVASFYEDENDLTANRKETIVLDQNGDKCALIKIETTQHNFQFDTGSLGIAKIENQNANHPSEIWLYVPHGVKKISIQHPQLGKISEYDLGLSVKRSKTYVLKLTSDQVNTMVVDYNNSQYLEFEVYPPNADVYINGAMFKLNKNGKCEIPLAFGIHNYRISAPDYHPLEGQIEINNKENKQVLPIRLKQAFGYLTISSEKEFIGAEVYIDDVHIGQLPIDRFSLKSGLHTLSISKKLYKPYKDKFAITDSGFVNISPVLDNNYADVEIIVANDNEAQIYDNGEYLGMGKWHGKLESGNHIIEAKKISHTSICKEIEVINGRDITISVENPKPIYGALEVGTIQPDVDLYIDGKKIGKTPFNSSMILVGEHNLEFRKKGYRTEIEMINIEEGKVLRLTNRSLTDFCNAILNTIPTKAKVFIDDKYVGNTPYALNMISGTYKVGIKAHGYSDYSKKLKLNGATEDLTIKLQRNYTRANEFYMQIGYNPFLASSITWGMGFFAKNFNVEVNCMHGVKSSEKIYWAEPEDMPVSATYKPTTGSLKLGYGFRLNSRIRITPQIGAQYLGLKENIEELSVSSDSYWYAPSVIASGANASSMTFGAKCNIAFSSYFGISVTPEYMIPIFKSSGFEVLSNTSQEINKYTKGFSGLINLNVYF